nr:hypothetical protein CFP56_47442 [Quercus suber]
MRLKMSGRLSHFCGKINFAVELEFMAGSEIANSEGDVTNRNNLILSTTNLATRTLKQENWFITLSI